MEGSSTRARARAALGRSSPHLRGPQPHHAAAWRASAAGSSDRCEDLRHPLVADPHPCRGHGVGDGAEREIWSLLGTATTSPPPDLHAEQRRPAEISPAVPLIALHLGDALALGLRDCRQDDEHQLGDAVASRIAAQIDHVHRDQTIRGATMPYQAPCLLSVFSSLGLK